MRRSTLLPGMPAAFATLALFLCPACDDSDDDVVIITPSGTVASDFQTLADYLADPVVQSILARLPRSEGAAPPDVSGTYDSVGSVTFSTLTPAGSPVQDSFCFGTPVDFLLDVQVLAPDVVDVGAQSIIEGFGDTFTIYTAYKSVQTDSRGATCEIHEVNIFSGIVNVDGSISDLYIGWGVVGILGPCSDILFVGDIQVSLNTAARVGESCGVAPDPGDPVDPDNVLVTVVNDLVTDVMIFLDDDLAPTVIVPPLGTEAFDTPPGFSVYFESLQPLAGQDDQGNDLLMGEILAGQFPVDVTPAGGESGYGIENIVGSDVYFAPLPLNQTGSEIFAVVNTGADIPWYPPLPGGLDCLCSMPPDIDPYFIGYYSYSLPGLLLPEQSNVYFYRVLQPTVIFQIFNGPFDLQPGTGTVTLLVD